MGKVPALVDGSLRLWESNAINLYAAEKHPQARLVPPSPEGRASMMRWLFFQASHVSPACVPIFRANHARMRDYYEFVTDPRDVEVGRKELARFLPILEAALSDREYIEGSFSLADVALAPHLWLVREVGTDLSPAVAAWLDRILARPAWRKAAALVYR